MKQVYRRELSYSESRYHYITIDKEHRDMFPKTVETFIVIVDSEKIEVAVGSLDRIWAAVFWDKLQSFKEGDAVVFSKNADGSFVVTIEK